MSFVPRSHISVVELLITIVLVPVFGEPRTVRLTLSTHLATSLTVGADSVVKRTVFATSRATTL